MLGERLQDRHWYAMGVTARHTGEWAEAFRPGGPNEPLAAERRFLKLPAQFVSAKGGVNGANLHGDPYWHGIFDASYTRVGDYIVGPSGTFFVASQVPLAPVLCVRTDCSVSLSRAAAQAAIAGNPYGGYVQSSCKPLVTGWPASTILNDHYGQSEASLPTDQPLGYLSVLLPPIPNVVLGTGDLMEDSLGRSTVLVAAELSTLGWRLTAKAVTN